MRKEVRDSYQYVFDTNQFPDWETYERTIYAKLKNTSAGGYKVKRNVFINPETGFRAGKADGDLRRLEITATQKPLVFGADPDFHLGIKDMLIYDVNNPMRAGSRHVTDGKPTRFVNMDRIGQNIVGGLFALPYVKYQQDTFYKDGTPREYNNPFDVPWCYTVGKETGGPGDHRFSLIASTLPNVVGAASDYTGFDTHSESWNAAQPHLDGALDALKDHGELKEGLTYAEVAQIIHGEGMAMKIKVISKGPVSTVVFDYDGLQSGKPWTLNFNNTTNRSIFLKIVDKMATVRIRS